MRSEKNIAEILNKVYLWDLKHEQGKELPERLLIERVFSYGTLDEIILLIDYFGKNEVEKILLNLNYMDPKTLNFASKYFSRPKKEFKCYSRKLLNPGYWNS